MKEIPNYWGLVRIAISPFLFSILMAGHPINIDGQFQDWENVEISYEDEAGPWWADFANVKITYDQEFLFIYFSFHDGEFLMQDWNAFHLYIDADNNSSTGLDYNGIGAELDWTFGQRQGFFYYNGGSSDVWQNDLTLRIAPTITSSEFEIAIALDSDILTLNATQVLVEGRIIISEAPPNSDTVPNEDGGIYFSIGEDAVPLPNPISFERNDASDIRIVTYNTLWNGIIEADRQPSFQRILQALDPDVIVLQEHTDWNEIDDIIQSWFPQEMWYASWTYSDLVVLSRFPILNDANLISSGRTMCALLDTENELGKNLLIVNSHLSCCGSNDDRQQQVDEFSFVWRNWVTDGTGPFELENETPFVHVGDFNFVGYRQQVETLRIGDIEDENEYGEDFLPDWDSTAIVDLYSRHTHKRMGYTWREDESSFNPGKLDYIFYSDATIDSGKHFIVNTLAMDSESLIEYGLEWDDTQEASDHLPRVFDISLDQTVGIDNQNTVPVEIAVLNNFPNPFNPNTTIIVNIVQKLHATSVRIYNLNGRLVDLVFQGELETGTHKFHWNGSRNSSGVYFIRLQSGDFVKTHKMILLK
ncbi:MAG: T9SS type A sorting domain-containing protein [Candidatus Marinimicrobia bacterium]|jgi:endonuclease/exonuclease/phosphatase family metal-dependent hydrolase|nr:T9SS type A sorting domain-containing protein [Candidatus Neomarinimicrobiota bacterium]MBT3502009.1 T9SS type A sorting domain-containing protein [Candidatus Neomarinimicrobiota bacterium]MBT5364465.1 T9SS type A sorting domain-containing protein [Candidatus Neomarinimicrobiota bacterium]MBT5460871.1 T9SS type A sorting domain-containing protein [Candidatus Neomarinimicrobiota bacterium]MBT6633044.1 T9SS type A sorting domain-containing protein [Candidatus Neomarinimicrobiota bacterium]